MREDKYHLALKTVELGLNVCDNHQYIMRLFSLLYNLFHIEIDNYGGTQFCINLRRY